MPTIVTKLAPQTVLLIVVVYWCWPFVMQTTPVAAPAASKDAKPAAMVGFTAAVLSPTFPPFPERNPFEFPGEKRVVKAKSDNNKKGTKNVADKAAIEAKGTNLVLKGTFIMGEQRMAYINGHVYKEKEAIPGQGEDGGSFVVTDIYPHKVLLSYQGIPLQLNYTNTMGTTRAASSAASDASRKSSK